MREAKVKFKSLYYEFTSTIKLKDISDVTIILKLAIEERLSTDVHVGSESCAKDDGLEFKYYPPSYAFVDNISSVENYGRRFVDSIVKILKEIGRLNNEKNNNL